MTPQIPCPERLPALLYLYFVFCILKIKTCVCTSISRHTVVCRAAQEAGAQPREYIDRKKQNAIFAPP